MKYIVEWNLKMPVNLKEKKDVMRLEREVRRLTKQNKNNNLRMKVNLREVK